MFTGIKPKEKLMRLSTLKPGDVFSFEDGVEIWRVYEPDPDAPDGLIPVGQVSSDRVTLTVNPYSAVPRYTDDCEVEKLMVVLKVVGRER